MSIIERALREALEAAADGDGGAFVTVESSDDPAARWIQVTWDTINAAYPFINEPTQVLADRGVELPKDVDLLEWKAGVYVTFAHGAEPLRPLVDFVEAYSWSVLGMQPSGALRTRLTQ